MDPKVIWFEARSEQYFIHGEPANPSELVQAKNDAQRKRLSHATVGGIRLPVGCLDNALRGVHDRGWYFDVVDGESGRRIDLVKVPGDPKVAEAFDLLVKARNNLECASGLRGTGSRNSAAVEESEAAAHEQIDEARQILEVYPA